MPLQGPNTSPLSFYWDLPPVTRTLITAFGSLRALQILGVLPVQYLAYLSWTSIFFKWQVGGFSFGQPYLSMQTAHTGKIFCRACDEEKSNAAGKRISHRSGVKVIKQARGELGIAASWQSFLLQIWRVVTPFLYLTGKGFEVLILLLWTWGCHQ